MAFLPAFDDGEVGLVVFVVEQGFMSGKDQRAVQAYLDDLLMEDGLVEPSLEPVSAPVTSSVPAAKAQSITPAFAPEDRLVLKPVLANERSLTEAGASSPLQSAVQALELVQRRQLQALLDRPAPAPAVPQAVPAVTVPAVTVPVSAEPLTEVCQPPVKAATPLLEWCENGRPVWAQKHFDVLLFRVAGLTLAVPLVALGHIHRITDGLTPIFGQADWFMGLQPTSAGRIRTVNTALFVMPERYDPAFAQSARYVVSIDGLDWGLAVDQVQQPTRLSPEDVTWRSERSKRPWLAGTVKAAMCALLDIPQMGRLLENHDRKRAAPCQRPYAQGGVDNSPVA